MSFERPLHGGFQPDFIAPRGRLDQRVMHEQPGRNVVFSYLIFNLPNEPGRLEDHRLFRPSFE